MAPATRSVDSECDDDDNCDIIKICKMFSEHFRAQRLGSLWESANNFGREKIRTREGEKNRWPTTFRYSINKSTMSELRKAVIKNADMTEDMQQVRALRNVF